MHKRILIIFLLFAIGGNVKSQITLDIADLVSCTSPVEVPIVIGEDITLISLQFGLQWDGTGLDYIGHTPPIFSSGSAFGGPSGDTLSFSWFDNGTHTLNAGDTIFSLQFNLIGSTGSIPTVEFYTGSNPAIPVTEAAAPGFVPIPITTQNGSVTIGGVAPSFMNCPANITVSTDAGMCDAMASWTPPTVEDCDNNANPPVSSNSPGEVFPEGVSTVVYTVNDSDGNSDVCSFTITVEDQEAPVLTCTAGAITVNAPSGQSSVIVNDPLLIPGQSDNCPSPTLTYVLSGAMSGSGTGNVNGMSFDLGTTTVTYTLSDGVNSDQCSIDVTVNTTAPNAVTLELVGDSLSCGETTGQVAVVIQDAVDAISVQFTLDFLPTELVYQNVSDVMFTSGFAFGPNAGEPFANNGTLSFSWFALNPISFMPGDTLFNINFNLTGNLGDCFPINFTLSPPPFVPLEMAAPGFVSIPVAPVNGGICYVDEIAPVLTCPVATTINCGESIDPSNTGDATAIDSCDPSPIISHMDSSSPGCGISQTIVRTFTAIDASGNSSSCSQTITVTDSSPPIFDSNPSPLSDINCDDAFPMQETLTANDNCGTATVTPTMSFTEDNCNGYIVTYTWTAEDECGNSIPISQTFNVLPDNQNPTFDSNPAPLSDINCDDAFPMQETLTASDNCGTATVTPTISFTEDNCNGYLVTYTWTAEDECGNSTPVSTTFNVLPDDQNPTFNSNPTPLADINCGDPFPTQETLTASDNCGSATVTPTISFTEDSCNGYLVTYTWTAEDECSNSTPISTSFNVLPDSQGPSFDFNPTPLADINCGDPFPIQETLTASDNCGTATVTPTMSFTEDNCNGYVVTYTWTAEDECSNSTPISISFNVLPDNQGPSFDATPATLNDINCNGVFPMQETLTATDNCGGATVVPSQFFVENICDGYLVTYTWIATDDCGNSTPISTTFNVLPDNEDPTFTQPADISLSCDQDFTDLNLTGTVDDAMDNCGATNSLVISSADDITGLSGCSGTGLVLRSWTATDACGNISAPQIQQITIVDNAPPVVTCQDITLELDASGQVILNPEDLNAGTTDNCGSNFIFTASMTLFSCANNGDNAVTLTASDDCGIMGSCMAIVTIEDNTNPTINCPSDTTLMIVGNQTSLIVNDLNATANDNCGTTSISYITSGATILSGTGNISGSSFNLGITTVTYTAIDATGNPTTCSFDVSINGAVTIDCPDNIAVDILAGTCAQVVNNIPVTILSGLSLVDSIFYVLTGATTGSGFPDASGNSFNVGVTTVTYTVVDDMGNNIPCSFLVSVNDNEVPTINCPTDTVATATFGATNLVVSDIDPISSDLCGTTSISYQLTGATIGNGVGSASGQTFNVGTTMVTYTADDGNGNTSNCSFEVTVLAIVDFTCPSDTLSNIETGTCAASINDLSLTINSGQSTVDSVYYVLTGATLGSGPNDVSSTQFNVGVTTVTYTVVDDLGDMFTCFFTVTIEDNENPIIACPNDTMVTTLAGNTSILVLDIDPQVSDLCGSTNVTYSLLGATTTSGTNSASGETFNIGTTTVTYTVIDDAGNEEDCAFTVTVDSGGGLDFIDCPSDTALGTDSLICGVILNDVSPMILIPSNEIDSLIYEISGATMASGSDDASGLTFNIGTSFIKYILTNTTGEQDSCTITVTVSDDDRPTATCVPLDAFTADPGSCSKIIMNNLLPITFDNCGVSSITYTITGATTGTGNGSATGTSFNVGTSMLTYIISDAEGNTTSCSNEIRVNDEEPPSNLSCPSDSLLLVSQGTTSIVVNNLSISGFTDNCEIDSVNYTLSGATIASGQNDASGNIFNLGSTLVSYSVIDLSGNEANCEFTVTIADDSNGIICPIVSPKSTQANECFSTVFDLTPIILLDSNFIDSVTYILTGATIGNGIGDASGNQFNTGTTELTYQVFINGSVAQSCSVNIIVTDGQDPVWSGCPNSITLQADANCLAIHTWNDPLATDNCAIDQIIGPNFSSGDEFPIGTTIITYSAIDESGNSAICSFSIIVEDSSPPTLSGPLDVTINNDLGQCFGTTTWVDPIASDNCSAIQIVTSNFNQSDPFTVGTTAVIYTAVDLAGNSQDYSFNITVVDNEPPVIVNCPPTDLVITSLSDCRIIAQWTEPIASDNCGINTFTSTYSPGDTIDQNVTVVYFATDASGNVNECEFDISIMDQNPPIWVSVPDDVTVSADANSCSTNYTWQDPVTSDDCGTVNISSTHVNGASFSVGTTTTVTLTGTDNGGNMITHSFTVTVNDDEAPSITCPSEVVLSIDGSIISDPSGIINSIDDGQNCSGLLLFINQLVATDNCDGNIQAVQVGGQSLGNPFFPGSYVLQFAFTDNSGNSANCDLNITIEGLPTFNVIGEPGTEVCVGTSVQISPDNIIAGANFTWEGPNGFASNLLSPSININENSAGTYSLTFTTDNGCTQSADIELTISETPEISASSNSPICDGILELTGTLENGINISNWLWTGPCGFSSSNQTVTISDLAGNCSGVYTLTATSEANCTTTETTSIEVTSLPEPNISIACGDEICLGESCTIIGTEFLQGMVSYEWFGDESLGLPNTTNDNEILILPAAAGTFQIEYIVSVDDCETSVIREIVVTGGPSGEDDFYEVPYESTFNGSSVLANDIIHSSYTISVVNQPNFGTLIFNQDGTFIYEPFDGFTGIDGFEYEVCNGCGNEECARNSAIISVSYEGECIIPTFISPNGDGVNDVIDILCLDSGIFPNNEFHVSNRYGDEVFSASPYLNDWSGTLNGENGKDLPDGTYFYYFRESETTEVQRGFITILR